MTDPRKGNAQYYDLDETPLDDVPFYLTQVGPSTSVLELGCGTGRTLVPLAARCKEIVGIDYSADMIERCRSKIPAALARKCQALVGDITRLDLERRFDLLVAPYRVMQALESDLEVDGFLSSIKRHLDVDGKCILNVFNPKKCRDEMIGSWAQPHEMVRWERTLSDGSRVVHSEFYERISERPMVIFPWLIYRRYQGEKLIDDFTQKIKMRCYYPDEFKSLIVAKGFRIEASWGGYAGQKYGEGPELIVKFSG